MIPPINFFEHITTKQVHNNNNGEEMCVEEKKTVKTQRCVTNYN